MKLVLLMRFSDEIFAEGAVKSEIEWNKGGRFEDLQGKGKITNQPNLTRFVFKVNKILEFIRYRSKLHERVRNPK